MLLTTPDENLTPQFRMQKKILIKEASRKATKEVKESFFDYTYNPLFLAKMEQYVPFINFTYNSMKLFSKNPATWLFFLNTANNIMAEFSDPQYDTD